MYLVDENPEGLIAQFNKVLTEKQKVTVGDILKWQSCTSDFQMIQGDVRKQWRQWVNQVTVTEFNPNKASYLKKN